MKFLVEDEKGKLKVTLDNECGLKVVLNNIGASVYAIYFNDELMTMTPSNYLAFTKFNAYYGKTIGPIPNRLKDGLVKIGDKEYQMDQNEGENTLHSGKYGLSNQKFKYRIIDTKKAVGVTFTLVKKKKTDGLPGKVTYNVGYVLTENDNTLYVSISAFTDADTPLNMTNHTYFNLGENKIDSLKLTIPAHQYIETNKDNLLPERIKDIIPCLDFNKGKRIDKDIDDPYLQEHKTKGYDHCFLLDEGHIKLESKKYQLDIETNFNAAQIYSDNYPDDVKMIGTHETIHRGLAIEPQQNLLENNILGKRQFFSKEIKYHFIKK